MGIWSDGDTMWVIDWVDEKIYAYHTDGTRDASKEFDTLGAAGNNNPTGIWSDGATMWVADFGDEKIYAYRMSDQTHDSGRDFNTLAGAGNNNPYGIWSDGTTMWVADEAERKVYAYNLNTKARDASKEFSTSSTDISIANPAGIWSDGTTMWVANRFHQKLYAYRMSNKARDASKDFNTLGGAGNEGPSGIWSDGDTMWVGDSGTDKVYSYNMPPSSDATLSALTVSPTDIIGFTPGRTDYQVGVASTVSRATVAAAATNSGAAVAYSPADADLAADGQQVDLSAGRNAVTITVTAQDGSATRDYTVNVNRGVTGDYGWKAVDDLDGLKAARNTSPFGIWSNGTTIWVGDSIDDKLYAYNTDGTRDSGRDFNTLGAASNNLPRGIWSDGATMWVADSDGDKIYAYQMSDQTRDTSKEFNTLSGASNNYPTGIWSDGDTIWVADILNDKIYAYRMSDKERDASKDFNTLGGAGNHDPTGIWSDGATMWVADSNDGKIYAYRMSDQTHDIGRDFNTLSGAGNTLPYGIWSDSTTMWVSDTEDDKIYSYNMPPPPSSDATLSALTVGPTDIIGFDPDRTDYEVGVAPMVTQATITATANHPGASVAYSPTDTDTTTTVVDLSAGRNVVTVTVTSQDGSTTETYTVSVNRGVTADYGWKAVDDLDGLIAAGNNSPTGIWSNGATMWVADINDSKLYAYNTDGTRDSSRDFNTLSGASNNNPYGIWSDGTTMWVADFLDDEIHAYNLNTKAHDSSKDFTTLGGAGNIFPTGIWSDGTTMWVADSADGKLYAYNLNTKAHDSSKDFTTLGGAGDIFPTGIWSDGTTMWVADSADGKLYAYNLNTKAHDSDKEFNTLIAAGNNDPRDMWSDGTTMWVADTTNAKIYSYNRLRQQDVTTLVTNLDVDQFGGLPMGGSELKANSFTTAAGHRVIYELSGIRTRAKRGDASSQPTPLVTVHRDDGGQPAIDPLYTLENPRDILGDADTDYRTYTFSARPGAILDAGKTYWVVFAASGGGQYVVAATTSAAQTPQGWLIGDVSLDTIAPPDWQSGGRIVQFAILGKKVSPLEEEPDVDLPGGPADCHLTDESRAERPYPSSGHLTAGVDTDSGLTGDCFRLETQWGRQYRVEVEFGYGESVERGGSVWIVYTGSDFYGMSSLGSAVDHNREDGRSFTDFKHIHNGVKSYFVDVAAYDLYSTPYSTNSLTYNGPYTITMKDITGVQRMVTNIDPTLGSPVDYETGLSLSDGDTITLAAPFITGDHPEGYALDRIRVPFDDIAADEASPLISIYSNSSDTPSAKLCDLDRPAQIVESAVTWSGFPPPFTFLADDCAYNTLAASTPYWVVFTGVNPADYTLEMTTSAEEHDYYDTGWTMDNFLARSTDGGASWTVTAATAGNIRLEFWAKPKTNSAIGEPLARGQRFLPGQELTAGPGTVSDPDGTSRANYRYQWRRTDDQGVSTVIEGATGASYIITDDDRGHRVGVIVSFLDDAGNEESRASMATSYVPGQTRILIKKSGGTNNRAHGTVGLSSGFYTAAGDLKHRIESVTQILTAAGIGNINTDLFRFRLFTSNDASNPLDRKPAVEIATFTNPARVATGQKKFTAPTDALLAGGTTYHIVMYTGAAGEIGCEQLGSSQAHDGSLPNWELIQRTYPLTSENTAGSAYFGDPCNMRIDGYQLADAPHITSLEITSTPNTSPSYETGETISVTATLSEAVNFTGPEPVLPIRIGDNTREAIYDAGSSTTTQWVFQYIVLEEDRDDDGISVEQHALRAYADADLSHNAISTAPSHRVNARSLLRSVRVTSKPEAPNWYGPGETIQFTAEFTLPVTVTGDPEFAFSITSGGSTHARATYIGTTENRIVFEYTISTTDDDSDGIWIGDHTDTLRLDGDDAIVGVSNGRTAVLDHPEIGRLASHRIDQNPRIVTVAVTSDPTHGANSDTYAVGRGHRVHGHLQPGGQRGGRPGVRVLHRLRQRRRTGGLPQRQRHQGDCLPVHHRRRRH